MANTQERPDRALFICGAKSQVISLYEWKIFQKMNRSGSDVQWILLLSPHVVGLSTVLRTCISFLKYVVYN
jgi:hypothetical protein